MNFESPSTVDVLEPRNSHAGVEPNLGAALNYNPAAAFYSHFLHNPDRDALVGDGLCLNYHQATAQVCAIAEALGPAGRPGARVAILASRSVAACLAVLATLWKGATYVPLGLKLPE